jgi:hypothetical protein
MAIDLASFLGAGEQRLSENAAAQGNLKTIYQDISQGIFDQQKEVVSDSKGVTPLEAKTKGLAELEALNRTQAIGKALGLNPDLAADMQVQLATRRTEALKQTLAQQDKVSGMQSVGLFDDPLQFLVNQVMIPDEINKLNASKAIVDMASQQIDQIATDTTAAAQTSKLIASHTTQALVDDQIAAVEADIRGKKLAIGVQGDLALSHAVKDLNSLQSDQLNIRHGMLQAQNSAESLQMQRDARAQSTQLHNLQLQKYEDENQRQAHIEKTINEARMREGKPTVSKEMFKNIWGTNTAVGKELLGDYERGAAYIQGMPVTAAETISGRNQVIATLPPSDKYTDASKTLATAQSQAVAEAMEKFKGQKPEVIDAEAEKIFKKKLSDWQLKVDPKDQTNPFSVLPTGALDASQAIASRKAWQLYRGTNTDNKPFDTNDFLWNAVANVKAGKLDYRDAIATLKAIGQYSMQQNDQINKVYFITGQRQAELNVPVQYYTGSQVVARYATGVGAGATLAAAGTGAGLPVAGVLGLATAAAGKYSANPGKHLVSLTNDAQLERAFFQMLGTQVDMNALTGTGADALKPVTKQYK